MKWVARASLLVYIAAVLFAGYIAYIDPPGRGWGGMVAAIATLAVGVPWSPVVWVLVAGLPDLAGSREDTLVIWLSWAAAWINVLLLARWVIATNRPYTARIGQVAVRESRLKPGHVILFLVAVEIGVALFLYL
jgi:hypothetical protein